MLQGSFNDIGLMLVFVGFGKITSISCQIEISSFLKHLFCSLFI